MAQFVIVGTVGKEKKYLSSDAFWWSSRVQDARTFSTQDEANSILQSITSEKDVKMISVFDNTTHWDAPTTLRSLAELGSSKHRADVKISVCAISTIALTTQRWHVEDGKGRTKRLS